MINFSRTQLATGGTILALGALTAVAIGAQTNGSDGSAQKAAPVEVRTVVIHRTVNVTKVRKPKQASGSGGGASSGASPSYSSGYSGAPATVQVSAPATSYRTPSSAPAPVRSQTSGSGGSGGSYGGGEHEGGGDD